MKEKELYQKSIKNWGFEGQMLQVVEECSELNKIIIKQYNRNGNYVPDLIEETADVLIMVEQLMIMLGPDKVKKAKEQKLKKLARMVNEGDGHDR